MPEIRIVRDGDLATSLGAKKPKLAERAEGFGYNWDGRMFVDETNEVETKKEGSVVDNLPHGMSPADL